MAIILGDRLYRKKAESRTVRDIARRDLRDLTATTAPWGPSDADCRPYGLIEATITRDDAPRRFSTGLA
jgi:hypothetical protein